MKSIYLLPSKCRAVGLIMLIPITITGIFVLLFDIEFRFLDIQVFSVFETGLSDSDGQKFPLIKNNITNEICALLFIMASIMAGFSKQKTEDEYVAKIRLDSLLWATYLNYAVLAIALIFVYGLPFLTVMSFNIFTLLIFFLLRFYFILYTQKIALEKHN